MNFPDRIKRLGRHLMYPLWRVSPHFPRRSLERLQQGINESEHRHLGQICFVVESGWNAVDVWNGKTTRQRALEWFGLNRVWDTERNNGVLIYVSFADRAIEIIADRGIDRCVKEGAWQEICASMQPLFRDQTYIVGLEVGLSAVTELLCHHFPRTDADADNNELPDEVIVR